MGRGGFLLATTAVAVALLVWAVDAAGADSPVLAAAVVWLTMVWLGTVSHVLPPRLPAWFHRLRGWELNGRAYERAGVRIAKRVLRRGPLAAFNPGLVLPVETTPGALARLDQRMRDAEATHAILLVAMLAVAGHAALRGWWSAAGVTLVVDILLNGYPMMLQRYNRALLISRFPGFSGGAAGPQRT